MELISSNLLKYNIGLDVGNNLTNIIFNKNTIIPNYNKISFIVPELDEEYNINIIMGDNILSSDNILLETIKLIIKEKSDKVIHLEFFLELYGIIIKIDTKIKTIYQNFTNYYNDEIIYKDIEIDTVFYNLRFDILQTIKIIRKKINMKLILLDDESKEILEDKLSKIVSNIDNISNQKMLDIKNNLKMSFFID
jgi:hypothetical protein